MFIFTKAICDDDDTLIDTPPDEVYYYYDALLKNPLSQTGVLFRFSNDTAMLQQIIFYLERQEKSPPLSMPTVIF